jgi:glycosyltransferase involved in cell wall biosynthesis
MNPQIRNYEYTSITKLPLVSIVTPSYNHGQFIRETIRSVLSQDYPFLEYWVIDGGSSDGTLELLQEFKEDSRLHWISEKDHGQADAVNKGWALCNGEILGWLNSDDVYQPGAVKSAVVNLTQSPDTAFVYSDYDFIDSSNNLIKSNKVRQSTLEDLLLFKCLIPQQTVFIKRDVINKCGGLDISLHYALDQEYWIRILESYKAKYVPQNWAQQRIHETAKTQNQWFKLYQEFYQIILKYRDRSINSPDNYNEAIRRASINMFIVDICQGKFESALNYLNTAFSENKYPFFSASYCMKHIVYIIRHWYSQNQSDIIINNLIDDLPKLKCDLKQEGFILMLSAYNEYRNDQLYNARIIGLRAINLYPELRRDWYIAFFPWLCLSGSYLVRLARNFNKILKMLF